MLRVYDISIWKTHSWHHVSFFINWWVLNICDVPRIYYYSGKLLIFSVDQLPFFWLYKCTSAIFCDTFLRTWNYFPCLFSHYINKIFIDFYLLLCRLVWKRMSLEIIPFRCQWQNHVVLLHLLLLLIHWLVGKITGTQRWTDTHLRLGQDLLNFQCQILWR